MGHIIKAEVQTLILDLIFGISGHVVTLAIEKKEGTSMK